MLFTIFNLKIHKYYIFSMFLIKTCEIDHSQLTTGNSVSEFSHKTFHNLRNVWTLINKIIWLSSIL